MHVWYYLLVIGCFCLFEVQNLSSCTTPNSEEAYCKSLRECPALKSAFISEDPIVQKFFSDSESACGGEGLIVCCGTFGNYTELKMVEPESNTTEKQESKKEYAIRKLLPSKTYCGMQHTDDYFYNKTETAVNEFPWLLLVYYDDLKRKKRFDAYHRGFTRCYFRCISADEFYGMYYLPPPKVTYKCTGVLISNRYALTYGNCGSGESMRVTLGQYEENKSVTCIKTEFGEDDCTGPAMNVTVEQQIRSPNNSLLLLRLEKQISYTDFIRPICLPMDETIRPKIDDMVTTSGWGYVEKDNNFTVIKKRIKQSITSSEVCEEESSSDRLCTTLVGENNYICKSDTGGPVMNRHKHKNWYVEGLVNVDECVNDTVQGVRITPELVDWVLENMRD